MNLDLDVLIEEVYRRDILWDRQHKHHHNRYVLDKLWDEVAAVLSVPRLVARKKWKNLRDQFRLLLAGIRKPNEADVKMNDYDGEWKYFSRMFFLKGQFGSPPPCDNQDPVSNFSVEGDNDEDTSDLFYQTEELMTYSNEAQLSYHISPTVSLEDSECVDETMSNDQLEDDADLNFFKSLLPHLKSLSPLDQMDYRIKVITLTQEFMKKT